jgi:hypothetical protein
VLFVFASIEELLQAFCRANSDVMPAFRANMQVVLNSFAPDDLPARLAFLPQSFSPDVLFPVRRRTAFE